MAFIRFNHPRATFKRLCASLRSSPKGSRACFDAWSPHTSRSHFIISKCLLFLNFCFLPSVKKRTSKGADHIWIIHEHAEYGPKIERVALAWRKRLYCWVNFFFIVFVFCISKYGSPAVYSQRLGLRFTLLYDTSPILCFSDTNRRRRFTPAI